MYPLKFTPIYKERIWGGNNLETVFARELPSPCIGESWELCSHSHSHGTSIVENGNLAGRTLQEIMIEYQEKLMGKKFVHGEKFPLLVKIIDANDSLSIQVHPEDEYAYQVERESGKTEAWYVVAAKENAQIVYGLKENTTKEDFIKAVEANTVGDMVRVVPVKAGDMVFVPAGTVHALFAGVMVYEIQQNSDTTYRIYDYDRVGDNGKKREVHIQKAIEVINFAAQPSDDFHDRSIHCQYFSLDKLRIQGVRNEKTEDQFIIYCVIAGNGTIRYKDSEESLYTGDTILIPACLGEFTIKGNMELLKII